MADTDRSRATPDRAIDRAGSAGPAALAAGAPAQLRATDVVRLAYQEHRAELYGFLVSATRDADLAADVLHEAYARLLKAVRSGTPPLDARAWLFRVAGNLAISAARRRRVVARWAPWLATRHDEASPEQEYLRQEDERRVHGALAMLRPDDRVALLMAAHGCSGTEIAAGLGRTELATRSLLSRARLRLRAELERKEMKQ